MDELKERLLKAYDDLSDGDRAFAVSLVESMVRDVSALERFKRAKDLFQQKKILKS